MMIVLLKSVYIAWVLTLNLVVAIAAKTTAIGKTKDGANVTGANVANGEVVKL